MTWWMFYSNNANKSDVVWTQVYQIIIFNNKEKVYNHIPIYEH